MTWKPLWYCSKCGRTTGALGSGIIACRQCGSLGLRGANRTPRRVSCPDCDYRGWDDGGVNDDLGRHRRLEHSQ